MNIFQYTDYRKYFNDRIKETSPTSKKGLLGRICKATKIHPTVLSQVLGGQRDLNPEQAVVVSDFFGLDETKTQYFLLLVQVDRAGTHKLREILKKQIQEIQFRERQLIKAIPKDKVLSVEERSIFYSDWIYSGIRVLSSIEAYQSVEFIAQKLNLSIAHVSKVVRFLLDHSLCIQEGGKLKPGPLSTHIEATSPIVNQHHKNWRIQAMNRHSTMSHEKELAYTSPMTLSESEALKVREVLIETIQGICKRVDTSKCVEKGYFINIDWLEI